MKIQEEHKQFSFSPVIVAFPLYFVLFLWIIFWVEVNYDLYFTKYGLYPRSFKGLRGIVLSPFIHSGVKHLFNNSVPLLILLMSLLYFYRKIAVRVLFYGTLLSGFLTWIIARDSYHIGASGMVYLLFSFILFSGVISKNIRLIAVSLIVIFLYGSMIWYILPVKEEISWEGHLSGFIVGLLFALNYRKHGPKPQKYDWEDENYLEEDLGNPEDETIRSENNNL